MKARPQCEGCAALAKELAAARAHHAQEAARSANLLRLKRAAEAHRDAHHHEIRLAERRRVVDAIAKWVGANPGGRQLARSIRERWAEERTPLVRDPSQDRTS